MSPLQHVRNDTLLCEWDPAPYLLFSNEVEPLVYYSHLFPAFAAAILALVVLVRSGRSRSTVLFSLIAVLFAVYAIFDLILWATEQPSFIMTFWSLLTYIEPLIYALMVYLVLILVTGRDISLLAKYAGGLLLLPVFIFGPTNLNISGFDYTNCWRLAVEGPLLLYVYVIEIIFIIWMIAASLRQLKHATLPAQRRLVWFLLSGAILFLLSFSSGNIFGTLLQGVMGEDAWIIGQYGFFGMPVFLGFIMYLMVQYKIFSARIMYAEALLAATFIALLSLLFIPDMQTARPIIALTTGLFVVLGAILVLGIQNDLRQRKHIEELAEDLEKANVRLKKLDKQKSEFVSIASHQLRSPLTSIRGYASMLLEGSFGTLPKKAAEPLDRINTSAKHMAQAVEDYLNVSRIESGNMKYELADFNLRDEIEHICDDIRPTALRKGLVLLFRTDLTSRGIVNADIGKTVQIAHNLINNAMKYTEKGSITVYMRDDTKQKRIYVDITDTGVGMSDETLHSIFQKFTRAEDANKVNTTGTGLGLFVALKMAEAMGGTITAHSEGEGKGSRFTLELPLAM